MIFFTGDTHSSHNIGKLSEENFPEQKTLTRSDYVIICGDFGCVWDGSKHDRYWQDWLEDKPFTTLFVDGNHENYDLLNKYPTLPWHGGDVQFIRPHIIHLKRGQIFNIDGKKILTMGGAACHDLWNGVLDADDPEFKKKAEYMQKRNMFFRINHYSWWKEELPSDEEINACTANLDKQGHTVDYVVTHCLPDRFHLSFTQGGYTSDNLTRFLTEIDKKLSYRHWFCGHYHTNRMMDDKHTVLYGAIVSETEWDAAEPPDRELLLKGRDS